jgi:hypothetical protein
VLSVETGPITVVQGPSRYIDVSMMRLAELAPLFMSSVETSTYA